MSRAIGMLETYGMLPAVEGLDAALKSANVTMRSFDSVGGGLIAWVVEGDVGSVRVAVSAGKAAAARVGEVISENVIARLAPDVGDILPPVPAPSKTAVAKPSIAAVPASSNAAVAKPSITAETKPKKPVQTSAEKDAEKNKVSIVPSGKLDTMTVAALRTLARKTKGITLSRVEIRDAKKSDLVDAITKAQTKAKG